MVMEEALKHGQCAEPGQPQLKHICHMGDGSADVPAE